MKLGDNSAAVKGLQAKLVKLGYKLKADGDFGPKTDAAVRDFQAKAGLVVDGDVGTKTQDALDAAFKPKATPLPSVIPPPAPPTPSPFDDDGWYKDARRVDAHPGRVGAVINARGATVHTTDTMGGLAGMMKRMHETRSDGGGAHFWIGRQPATLDDALAQYPSNGLVQTVSIKHNGNHAGGPNGEHGRVLMPDGMKEHPNRIYIGIEIVCGGKLKQMQSVVRHPDSNALVPEAEVFRDERGKPWHRVTDYQLATLAKLLDDLDAAMAHLPDGCKLIPNGSYQLNGVTWAALPGTRVVTHVALDPIRKTDPGPQVTAWLRERGYVDLK